VKLLMMGGVGPVVTMKSGVAVAVPPVVVTVIGPVVAPAGTVAVICVVLATVNVALTPLNRTFRTLAKLAPKMLTTVPTGPDGGVKLLMMGGVGPVVTMKSGVAVAVPPVVVTVIGPVVAPAGTVAVICVVLATVNVALTPLNRTFRTLAKLAPKMLTTVPTGPDGGVKLLMMGGVGPVVTMKSGVAVAVPAVVVTVIGPVVAPAGTVAVICVVLATVNVALTPLNRTFRTLAKLAPKMLTTVPTGPDGGVKLLMMGGVGAEAVVTTKGTLLTANSSSSRCTLIGPVVAPLGTVARICVSLTTSNAAGTSLKHTCRSTTGSGLSTALPTFTVLTPSSGWKPVPLMENTVPTGPLVGVKPVMVISVDGAKVWAGEDERAGVHVPDATRAAYPCPGQMTHVKKVMPHSSRTSPGLKKRLHIS
jgi:hypothetical protein